MTRHIDRQVNSLADGGWWLDGGAHEAGEIEWMRGWWGKWLQCKKKTERGKSHRKNKRYIYCHFFKSQGFLKMKQCLIPLSLAASILEKGVLMINWQVSQPGKWSCFVVWWFSICWALCGLAVREFCTQAQSVNFFLVSFMGKIVLNAELKSTNSIVT